MKNAPLVLIACVVFINIIIMWVMKFYWITSHLLFSNLFYFLGAFNSLLWDLDIVHCWRPYCVNLFLSVGWLYHEQSDFIVHFYVYIEIVTALYLNSKKKNKYTVLKYCTKVLQQERNYKSIHFGKSLIFYQ